MFFPVQLSGQAVGAGAGCSLVPEEELGLPGSCSAQEPATWRPGVLITGSITVFIAHL